MQIKFVPTIPHCFAFGGFEIQLLSTFDSLKKLDVNVSKIDPWSREADFDILHCWGMNLSNYETVEWAKKKGKKVVLTALLDFYDTPEAKIRHFITTYITRVGKYFKKTAERSDEIVVVSDLQADILSKYFKISFSKINVIPHLVSAPYFDGYKNGLANKIDFQNYILCTGNICSRKNQLNLAKAVLQTEVNLMLIGNVLSGEENYGKELEDLIKEKKDKIHWIKGLPESSDAMINAYKSCTMFALPSFMEMQPISALEAAVMQKPILLANKPYSRQKYYQNAQLINPMSISAIKNGIENVLQSPASYIAPAANLDACKEQSVAQSYLSIYKKLAK